MAKKRPGRNKKSVGTKKGTRVSQPGRRKRKRTRKDKRDK